MAESQPDRIDVVERPLHFRVLGPLEVRRGGELVGLGAMKLRVLLAALLLRQGRQASVDTLLRRLWETDPPPSAHATLQTYVTRLRRGLGVKEFVKHRHGGYLIEDLGSGLDLNEFDRLVESAREARTRGDNLAALASLRRATALWRGTVLSDIESSALQREDANPLQERCLLVAEQRYELELAAGNHRDVVDELRALAIAHPLQEGIRAHLMLALHRSGRRADALEVYRETRGLFQAELGLEPGATLNALHMAILRDEALEESKEQDQVRQAVRVAVGEGADDPSHTSPDFRPYQAVCLLPPAPGDFIGRAASIADLTDRLGVDAAVGVVPIVAVSGVAGVGKSALALQLAHRLRPRFPDGQLYVNLHGTGEQRRDSSEVLGELLRALGWAPPALPRGLAARAGAFRARLADRRVLIVLDDAAESSQVAPLLPGTPGAAVIVTSRSTLSELPAAHQHRLPPLSRREAVELLRRMIDDERVDDEPARAEELVELCGYLPLAIRIVGARLQPVPDTPLRLLAQRLRDERRRLDELAVGRLQIRAELMLAYQGLTPRNQTALRRLGMLHLGHFPAWMLGELCDDDGERLVEQLTAAGLLEPAGTDFTGQPRYRPHDLIALYAQELASQDDHTPFRRYLDTLTRLAAAGYKRTTRVNEGLPPDECVDGVPAPPDHLAPLIADPDTWIHAESGALLHAIQAACRYGWHREAALLADLVIPTLAVRGDFERLQQARARIRDAALAGGDEVTAYRAETSRADILLSQRIGEASAAFETCVSAFRRLGLSRELVHSLTGLAFARLWEELPAVELAEEATAVAYSSGDPDAIVLALRTHAETLMADRPAAAFPLLHKALEVARGLPNREPERVILVRMTDCALRLGELEDAEATYAQALDQTDAHNTLGMAWLLMHNSRILIARGSCFAAMVNAERARDLMLLAGDTRGYATTCLYLAEYHLTAEDPRAAAKLADKALAMLDEHRVPRLESWARRIQLQAAAHQRQSGHTAIAPQDLVPGWVWKIGAET